MKRKLLKYILVLVIATNTSLYANFADTYGFSAKAISKGNAVTASVNDWSSVYYNVAGLGRTVHKKKVNLDFVNEGNLNKKKLKKDKKSILNDTSNKKLNDEFAISYMFTYPIMQIDANKNMPGESGLQFGTTTIGLVLDLNHFVVLPKDIVSSARFGLGLGVMQDGTLVKINDVDLRAHNYMRYGREAQRTVIFAGAGFGFLNDLFGFGLGANVWTKGEGKVQMENLELSSGQQIPTQQVMMDLGPAVAPTLGLYFNPGKLFPVLNGLEYGLSYRGEIYMDLPLTTNANMMLAGVELEMGLYVLDYYTPNAITTGFTYNLKQVSEKLTISVDFEYQMWSKFKMSKAKEQFITNYNADNEASAPDVLFPEMKDVFIPKIGISYSMFSWLALNGGYFYRTSFLADDANNTIFNYLDNKTHVGSLGVSFIVPKTGIMVSPIEINLTTQFQYLVQKNVVKEAGFETAENPNYSYSGMVPSVMIEVIMRW